MPNTSSPPRPGPAEYAPYYEIYVQSVPDGDLVGLLAEQLGGFESALAPLDDEAAQQRYAPGKWSIKEVIGHIMDAERIFAYRLLCISRGDETPLPGFEQNSYVEAARFDTHPIAALLEDFRAVRASTLALVRSVDERDWARHGTASGFGVSARALAYIIAGHTAHHMRMLREKYGLKG